MRTWLRVGSQTHWGLQSFPQLPFDEPVVQLHRDGVLAHTLRVRARIDEIEDRSPKSLG